MHRTTRWLAAALLAVITGGLALAPSAEARHFGRFGFAFGYGYPAFYGAPLYAPPPVYYVPRVAYIPRPPLVYRYYSYGYHYRRVHRPYRRIVHRSWCSCHCCR